MVGYDGGRVDRYFNGLIGNTTSDNSSYTSITNITGRLAKLTKSGATSTYSHNNQGQRVRKFISAGTGAGSSSTVLFVYDQDGHLLGEYNNVGTPLREYVWFGDIPVAMFTPNADTSNTSPTVYRIHADHLNTPRVLLDYNWAVRWRWMAEPFGTTAPQTNPSSLGAVTQNLRFPGQYFDQESGLNYNWNRSYDPGLGRYAQSDPIGLEGGINTYAYVEGNPLSKTDPLGLQSDARPNRPNWPGFMQPTQPNRNCATAECAAGLPPAPSENRTQKEVDYGQCKLVCQISLAVPVAACNAALGGGLPGTAAAAAAKGGLCSWACK